MSCPHRVGTPLLAFQSHTNEWDGRADGAFYYSVRTTGVYCRPSCAARLAKPAEICRLLRGDLNASRLRKLMDEMHAAGLPM